MPRPKRGMNDPFILGFLGRLKEEKGLNLMIDALTYLPDYCQAVFIGQGPMKGAGRAGSATRAEPSCLLQTRRANGPGST